MSLRILAGLVGGVALAAFAVGASHQGAHDAPPGSAAVRSAARNATVAQNATGAQNAAAAQNAAPRSGSRAPAATLAVAPPSTAKAAPVPASLTPPPATRTPRVPAGVLARAASRRAHERDAACTPPKEGGAGAQNAPSAIHSVEIDWNARPHQP